MTLVCTFVHGYEGEFHPAGALPALVVANELETRFFEYDFPRNPAEFNKTSLPIKGEMPLGSAKNFEALPRFGFTGLSIENDYLYCGSWNGVYRINKNTYQCESFVTHRLMNDLHGICAHEGIIYTMLTGKDTVVATSLEGDILETFTVHNDMGVIKDDPGLLEYDWRFMSKQFRGATGVFHFNHVQIKGREIWLTSRNLGCFVVVDMDSGKAHLRTINQKTVVLLHDGIYKNGAYYFTSIDGKILISSDAEAHNPRENFDEVVLFNRDLNSKVIRLEETELGRQPNWCRGIDVKGHEIATTIDGLYGSDLSFKLLTITEEGKVKFLKEIRWEEIGDISNLRYVTGFDVKFIS
jgi:hypothetical protein